MQKKLLTIFAVLAVALLFTGASGCLERTVDAALPDSSLAPGLTASPGFINSVSIYEMDGNLIALIQVAIQGTHAQSLDEANITVTINGNTVEVYVPVVTKDGINTKNIGIETVSVIIGKASDFEGKKYDVIVNGNNALKNTFVIENNVMTTLKPASFENVEIKTDGNKLIALVTMGISGSQSIDVASIIKSEAFENNEYDIYIPVKSAGLIMTMDYNRVSEEFVLGELSQFEDGVYTININGQPITFEIKNKTLID
jgi:hypothetical protein